MSEQHSSKMKLKKSANPVSRPRSKTTKSKFSPLVVKKLGKGIPLSNKSKFMTGLSGKDNNKGRQGKARKGEKERQHLKQKFLCGGNDVDPLNLNAFIGKEGTDSPRNESPVVDRGQEFEPGDIRPVDESDPLKLNCLEDENLVIKAGSTSKKHKSKKKRQKHHRQGKEINESHDTSQESQESQDSEPGEEGTLLAPKAKVQKMSKDLISETESTMPMESTEINKTVVLLVEQTVVEQTEVTIGQEDAKHESQHKEDNVNILVENNCSTFDNKKHHKFSKKLKLLHHKETRSQGNVKEDEKHNSKNNEDDVNILMENTFCPIDPKKKHKLPKKQKLSIQKEAQPQENVKEFTEQKEGDILASTNIIHNFRAKDEKFRYGNYNRYYGYRNPNVDDDRIQCMQREWFDGNDCLDIGCNVGHLTLWIARHMNPKTMLGIDIDDQLIKSARNNIRHYVPTKDPQAPCQSEFPISFAICHGPLAGAILPDKEGRSFGFPYNITFTAENYIPKDSRGLDNVRPEYHIILCLSVTKWVQLNWGDEGVKRMFKKVYLSLKPGGRFLLEPQPWKSYKKKKNLTPLIRANYEYIKFHPDQYIRYLLSSEVGFASSEVVRVPQKVSQGFQRPLYLLTKGSGASASPKLNDVKQEDVFQEDIEQET